MDNNEELQIIKTIDENGAEIELKLLDIVSVEGVDYALLLPADEDMDEESEVVLMRMIQENDEYIFETIEDDAEFDAVAKALADEEGECDDDCDCCHHD